MSMNAEQLKKIAKLSRLEIPSNEEQELIAHFNGVLNRIDIISNINTDNVPPLVHILQKQNVFREDIAGGEMDTAELLSNAPSQEDGAFLVPKVLV